MAIFATSKSTARQSANIRATWAPRLSVAHLYQMVLAMLLHRRQRVGFPRKIDHPFRQRHDFLDLPAGLPFKLLWPLTLDSLAANGPNTSFCVTSAASSSPDCCNSYSKKFKLKSAAGSIEFETADKPARFKPLQHASHAHLPECGRAA